MKRKSIASEDKKRLLEAHSRNEDFILVAEQLGIKKGSAYNIIAKWKKAENIKMRRRPGIRRSKITPEIGKDLIDYIETNTVATLQEMQNLVNQKYSTSISLHTISTYLKRQCVPFKKFNSISYEKKKLVMEAHSRNEDFLLVAKELGINKRYVYNIISRWRKAERLSCQRRRGNNRSNMKSTIYSNFNGAKKLDNLHSADISMTVRDCDEINYPSILYDDQGQKESNICPMEICDISDVYQETELTKVNASDDTNKENYLSLQPECDPITEADAKQSDIDVVLGQPLGGSFPDEMKQETVAHEALWDQCVNTQEANKPHIGSDIVSLIDKNCFLILQQLPKLVMPGDTVIRVKSITSNVQDQCQDQARLFYEDVTHLVKSHKDSEVEVKVEETVKAGTFVEDQTSATIHIPYRLVGASHMSDQCLVSSQRSGNSMESPRMPGAVAASPPVPSNCAVNSSVTVLVSHKANMRVKAPCTLENCAATQERSGNSVVCSQMLGDGAVTPPVVLASHKANMRVKTACTLDSHAVTSHTTNIDLKAPHVLGSFVMASQMPGTYVKASNQNGNFVVASELPEGCVVASQIPNIDVKASQVPGSYVVTLKMPGSCVQTSTLQGNLLVASQLPEGCVVAPSLPNMAMNTSQMPFGFIISPQLIGNYINTSNLQNNIVVASQLPGSCVVASPMLNSNAKASPILNVDTKLTPLRKIDKMISPMRNTEVLPSQLSSCAVVGSHQRSGDNEMLYPPSVLHNSQENEVVFKRRESITYDNMKQLVDSFEKNEDFLALANELGIKKYLAYGIIKNWKKGDPDWIFKRSTAKNTKITPVIGQHLVGFVECNSLASLHEMQESIVDKFSTTVSFQTITKYLQGQCLSMRPRKTRWDNYSVEAVKQLRYEYVRAMLDEGVDFDRCVFLDWCPFNFWLRRSCGQRGQRGQRWTSLWLCVAVSVHKVVHWDVVEGGLSAQPREQFTSVVWDMLGREEQWRFIQDTSLCDELDPRVKSLPPMSPFLNPLHGLLTTLRTEVKAQMCPLDHQDQETDSSTELRLRKSRLKFSIDKVVSNNFPKSMSRLFFDTHRYYVRCLARDDIEYP